MVVDLIPIALIVTAGVLFSDYTNDEGLLDMAELLANSLS
jgi:hypothetical protein